MNIEYETGCEQFSDDRLRLATGVDSAPRAEFAEHLTECADCRAELEEQRGLLGALEAALTPEPVAEDVITRIQQRAHGEVRRQSAWSPLLRPSIAAAAALAAVIAWPQIWERPAVTPDETFETVPWDGDVTYAADEVETRIETMEGILQRAEGSDSYLPWSADDDWDMPLAEGELPDADTARSLERRTVRANGAVT